MHKTILPENKTEREEALNQIVSVGKRKRNVEAAKWWYTMLYMQGARDFKNINYRDGTVDVEFSADNSRENLQQFKYEGVVSKYQGELGRVRRIDLNPDVGYRAEGLDSQQRTSIARMVLRSLIPPHKVERFSDQFWSSLLQYGTLGVCVWSTDNQNFGLEVVMPWELLPVPANVNSPSEARGLVRRRHVPVNWLKGLDETPSSNSKVWSEMEKRDVPISSNPNDNSETDVSAYTETHIKNYKPHKNEKGKRDGSDSSGQGQQEVTELVEVWMYTEDNHLGEYIVMAGGKELSRNSYEGQKKQVPIHIARYIDAGGFWGRGFAEMLIPSNSEIEFMAASLFQNIEDLDLYGILLEPTTLGIDASAEMGADGIKRLKYEPDLSAGADLKPSALQPTNSGTLPGKVMEMAHSMMDMLANQPTEMMQGGAPGRVDSSSGLGRILETANIPLTPVAANVASAMTGCYRYILDYAKRTWSDGDTVRVVQIDDALAGIQFDSEMGQMSLSKNAIPSPEEVNITVASQMPRSTEREKMELKESLQLGLLSPMEFRIEVRKRGLNIPVGAEEEWQNYRKAVIENILMFNDGKTPGSAVGSERDMHEVHLKAHNDFMSRPEFLTAPKEIRDKFESMVKFHTTALGDYPDQLPYPEEVAGMMQQGQGQGQQGQGQQGQQGLQGLQGMM